MIYIGLIVLFYFLRVSSNSVMSWGFSCISLV